MLIQEGNKIQSRTWGSEHREEGKARRISVENCHALACLWLCVRRDFIPVRRPSGAGSARQTATLQGMAFGECCRRKICRSCRRCSLCAGGDVIIESLVFRRGVVEDELRFGSLCTVPAGHCTSGSSSPAEKLFRPALECVVASTIAFTAVGRARSLLGGSHRSRHFSEVCATLERSRRGSTGNEEFRSLSPSVVLFAWVSS